jgi:hypothetical protein
MKATNALLIVALAAPFAAQAQSSRSQARIEPPLVTAAPVSACMARQETLGDRQAFLAREKSQVDRDAEAIALEDRALAEEMRGLRSTDVVAVSAYNARSADHNRRVAEHNRRVADMNAAASALNSDSDDMMAYCSYRDTYSYTYSR